MKTLNSMFRRIIDRGTHDHLDEEEMVRRIDAMSNSEFLETLSTAHEELNEEE